MTISVSCCRSATPFDGGWFDAEHAGLMMKCRNANRMDACDWLGYVCVCWRFVPVVRVGFAVWHSDNMCACDNVGCLRDAQAIGHVRDAKSRHFVTGGRLASPCMWPDCRHEKTPLPCDSGVECLG